jgi:hypothetical protein
MSLASVWHRRVRSRESTSVMSWEWEWNGETHVLAKVIQGGWEVWCCVQDDKGFRQDNPTRGYPQLDADTLHYNIQNITCPSCNYLHALRIKVPS